MDNVLKFILIGAGVVICIGLITWNFLIKSESENTINSGLNQMSALSTEIADSNKTMYDGLDLSGSEVNKVIKKFENELGTTFTITVKTLANATTGKVYSVSPIVFTASGTDDYINPYGQFSGSVVYNANEAISGLVFTQRK